MNKYEPKTMKDTFLIIWKKAKGCYIYDNKGKKYLDFTSGIFVTNVGHMNKHIVNAIKKQTDALLFSFAFPTKIRDQFVNQLMSMVPLYLDSVLLFSEGGMATDKAIQVARMYTKKHHIVTLRESYHGSTVAWNEIDKSSYKLDFPKSILTQQSFERQLKQLNPNNICAFFVEGYQGWSAYTFTKEYIKKIQTWCHKNNILFVVDEIQSGFMRTGKMFCFQHYGVKPDLVIFGKAVSGGLPLSGILGNKKILSCFDGKKLISNTHSGNTLVLASALANLKEIKKIKEKDIKEKSVILFSSLQKLKKKYPQIISIHGIGLIAAIHFYNAKFCDKITYECIKKGLMLVRTRKGTIKIGPPLTITEKQIKQGISIIDKVLEKFT